MERGYRCSAQSRVRKIFIVKAIAAMAAVMFLTSPIYADCQQAKVYFQQATELSFDLPNILKKEQLYKKAIQLCPTFAEAHNNLGDLYERQGRYEEAIAEYNQAINYKPEAPDPYLGLGDIYYKTNRPEEGLKWYEKGIKKGAKDEITFKRKIYLKDIKKSGVIKAETITQVLNSTRGAGEVVSLSFGEGLIPFDYDKSHIRPDAGSQLKEIGKALQSVMGGSRDIAVVKLDPTAFEIAGHTDARGSDAYNLRLSQKRAEAVVQYLTQNFGIPRERLIPRGYGKRRLLCTSGDTEGCHGLNRRVEIIKTTLVQEGGTTRTRSAGGKVEPLIKMEVGFFYLQQGGNTVQVLQDESRLRSRADKYFIFFRPQQDCYVYLLQKDAAHRLEILFPREGSTARVQAGRDYWLPIFGKAFSLDEIRGEERISLLATAHPLEAPLAGLSLKEQVKGAINTYQTRAIRPVRPQGAPEALPAEQLHDPANAPQSITPLLEKIEGEGGWVKVVTFQHE